VTANTRRRINFLSSLINAQNYLEIGVCTGKVFNQVTFPGTKVAVDPVFKFDTTKFSNPNTLFFECTSDHFFEQYAGNISFDIAFIDGLHTYDQTFADLCNVLLFCKNSSFILIDDTFPSDQFSALRSQRLCGLKRGESQGWREKVSSAWHGDTYKIMYLINFYLRSFDYATIFGSGNPQTLLWKKSLYRQDEEAPFNRFYQPKLLFSLTEKFESLNYFKTMECYEEIFQKVAEQKLFDYLKNSRI